MGFGQWLKDLRSGSPALRTNSQVLKGRVTKRASSSKASPLEVPTAKLATAAPPESSDEEPSEGEAREEQPSEEQPSEEQPSEEQPGEEQPGEEEAREEEAREEEAREEEASEVSMPSIETRSATPAARPIPVGVEQFIDPGTGKLNYEQMLHRYHQAAHANSSQTPPRPRKKSRPSPPSRSSGSSTSSESGEDGGESDPGFREEQRRLNLILNDRNKFSLMPREWKMHFRGIPLPDGLFYTQKKASSDRPRIYARNKQFDYRGAMMLRKLIDTHARVRDIRTQQQLLKQQFKDRVVTGTEWRDSNGVLILDIKTQLSKALKQAVAWASEDGDLVRYRDNIPPLINIISLDDQDPKEDPDRSDRKINAEMRESGAQWRNVASEGAPEGQDAPQAPVIFGFVLLKHIILIVTLDSSNPGARCHVACSLNMSEFNQHQWNALAVMVTICWARDHLAKFMSNCSDLAPEAQGPASDPDA
ncbi:hypothetical protein GGR56DRAFT_37372 [Xylariaceae sp. FL0804]|nr:hypothetical protein GGR56DRAFT_37372 [Xylariaceae sp. FL0804]